MNNLLNKVRMRLPAFFMLVVTLLFWGLYDRYEAVGPPLLESPNLADAYRVRGASSETNGVFTLVVPEGGKTAEVRFLVPGASEFSYIRLDGRIRTENVVLGKYRWSSARLLLIQWDAQGKWIPVRHNLLSEEGATAWIRKVNEFEVEPDAESIEVVLQHIGKSGRADFDRIIAQPVRIRSSFVWFRILFSAAWVGLGLVYFRRCRLDHRRLHILIILNVFAILCGTLMPGEWIDGASNRLKKQYTQMVQKSSVEKSVPPNKEKLASKLTSMETKRIEQFKLVVDRAHQVGHFALFASLCFLVYCSAWLEKQHPAYYFKVGLDVLLFAAVSESLQYLTMSRMPGYFDWLTDVYGMALAFGIFLLVRIIATLVPTSGKVKEHFGI